MSKFSRVVVLVVGLMSVFAAMAGAASASTWHNTGDTAFTATTGPGTLTANGTTLICTGATATGTAPASAAGPTYPVSGTVNYTGCRLGILSVSVSCTYTLTGASLSGSVTTGSISVNCTVTGGCTVTGTIAGATYTNAATGVRGRLAYPASNSLVVGGAGCILGSGSASLTAATYTVTSGTGGPILRQP
jgi:hypothetical protein